VTVDISTGPFATGRKAIPTITLARFPRGQNLI
jgi:hypothetical protein